MTSEEWNEAYPVGTKVRYFPIMGEHDSIDTTTRSPAWDLAQGTPIVAVTGKSGGVSLDHLKVIED